MENSAIKALLYFLCATSLGAAITTRSESIEIVSEPTAQLTISKSSLRSQPLPLKKSSLQSLANRDRLFIEANGERLFDAEVYHSEEVLPGITSVIAKQEMNASSHFVIATQGQKRSHTTIVTQNGLFSLVPSGSQFKLINQSTLPDILENDEVLLDNDVFHYDLNEKNDRKPDSYQPSAETMTEIGLMLVHTPEADAAHDNDLASTLAHLVTVTNQIFLNSGAKIQFKLVGIEVVNYDDPFDGDITIDEMRNESNPAFEGLSVRRYELGADMVMYANDFQSDASLECGGAGVPGLNGTMIYAKVHMFSTIGVGCQEYVMAHELGHNLGIKHSREQSGDGTIFPYALGYGVLNKFVTVMAYRSAFNNAEKIYLFSNPLLDCNDLPCGISKDSSEGADAVTSMNQIRETVADFYDSEPALEATKDTLTFNNISNDLANCIYQNGINSPNDYSGNLEEIKCNSLSLDNLDGIEFFPHLNSLIIQLSNVTNIDALEELDNIFDLNLAVNNISEISSIGSLINLKSLNLSSNQISDVTALRTLERLLTLDLSSNPITSLESISELPYLSTLAVNHNPDMDLNTIGLLSELESLSLLNSSISDLSPIKNLDSLKRLILSTNSISDIELLSNFNSLHTLDLSNNRVKDISPIFGLVNHVLVNLDISDNDELFCWQQDYLQKFVANLELTKSTSCDNADDTNDFDSDGISNRQELNQNSNPIVKNQIESSDSSSSGGGTMVIWSIALLFMKRRRLLSIAPPFSVNATKTLK